MPAEDKRQSAFLTNQTKAESEASESNHEIMKNNATKEDDVDERRAQPSPSDLQILALEKVFKTKPKQKYKPKYTTNETAKVASFHSAHKMKPLSGAQMHLKTAALTGKALEKKGSVQFSQEPERNIGKKNKRKIRLATLPPEEAVGGADTESPGADVWMARGFSPMRKLATLTPTRQFCPHCHHALIGQEGETTFGAPILKKTCKGREYPQCPGTGRDNNVYKPPGSFQPPCDVDEASCRADTQRRQELEAAKASRKSIIPLMKHDGGFVKSLTRLFQ